MTDEYVSKIVEIASTMGEARIMEVCGGHTNTIVKYGIRELLPSTIKLISGPGCPVCVTDQYDIDCMIELAMKGVKVATYGDMMHVPGTKSSLYDAQAKGADIQMVYSVDEITDKERVFFAVGFETTTPMTATLLERGFVVYSAHKVMGPPMKLLASENRLDGFIDPGHVSAIIGADIWSEMELGVPQVISGFKPKQLIRGIYELLVLLKQRENKVVNMYPEVVLPKGNVVAQELIRKTMKQYDAKWRGMGEIPASGLIPRNENQDARIKFKDMFSKVESKENPACRCGEIVRGMCEPQDCKLFRKVCTPENPKGACMVSETEGACGIAFKYGKSLAQ